MPRFRSPVTEDARRRRVEIARRAAQVSGILQALTVDGNPVPLARLAARVGMPRPALVTTLHDMTEHPGSGPLFVDGGWVWVQMGPDQEPT